jgi:glycosyltransferase involved in cell wall biosynthesis
MRSNFRIHCYCLAKNEVDIIGACLSDALRWADYVYVYDNGSTDGTWDKVRAVRDERVVAWKSEDKPFQESLRAEIFQAFRHRATEGDWWCQLDADEFYLDNPRDFLACVPPIAQAVWSLFVEYYLTCQDLDGLDFSLPIETILGQLHYYRANHSEPRFFRHRRRLVWHLDRGHPTHMGVVYPQRIRLRHYKYRSPEQIQRRLDTRREARRRGFPGWEHAAQEGWREKIAEAGGLHYDDGSGRLTVDEQALPNHLGSRRLRIVRRVMHGLGIWP